MSIENTNEKYRLLTCPFCGSPAELDTCRAYRPINGGPILNEAAIYCTGDSGCPADMSIPHDDDAPDATIEQLVEELVACWNRRHTNNWMPIESAPMDGSMILVLAEDKFENRIFEARWSVEENAFTGRDGFCIYDTAFKWLPIPEET